MKLVTCPEVWNNKVNKRTLFLAGGITNCPNWQFVMADKLRLLDVILLNPRRNNFDSTDRKMGDYQIEWEHMHLALAEAILFWFPKESLCPITLFEYGKWFNSSKRIFIATHPKYSRRFDIEKQTWMDRPQLQVGSSLTWLAEQVIRTYTEK